MRRYETKTHVTKVFVEMTCDVCGAAGCGVDWAKLPEVAETSVTCEVGVADRDGGGAGRRWTFDICPTCFETHLVPHLRSLGADVEVEEYEH